MRMIRRTHRLPDGRELEIEAEERGPLVRLRARLVDNALVTAAMKATANLVTLLLHRDFLPKEFADDPQIRSRVFEPLEEIWAHRLRLTR